MITANQSYHQQPQQIPVNNQSQIHASFQQSPSSTTAIQQMPVAQQYQSHNTNQQPSNQNIPPQHHQQINQQNHPHQQLHHPLQQHQQLQSHQQSVIQQNQPSHIQHTASQQQLQPQQHPQTPHQNQFQKTHASQQSATSSQRPVYNQQQQQQYSHLQQNHLNVINSIERRLGGNIIPFQNQYMPQKMAPRNNEYLEKQQQNKNFDLRGPSPAQATDANVETNQTPNHQIKDNRNSRSNSTSAVTPKNSVSDNQTSPSQVPHLPPPTPSGNQQTQQINAQGTIPESNVVVNNNEVKPGSTASNSIENKPVMGPAFLQRTARPKDEPLTSLPVSKIDDLNWNALTIQLNVIPKPCLELLQENADIFPEKYPAMAKKLGIIPDEDAIFARIKNESKFSNILFNFNFSFPTTCFCPKCL